MPARTISHSRPPELYPAARQRRHAFLQRLRDEAHRYAIGTHRNKRAKAEFTNPLDAVPGIGRNAKKRYCAFWLSAAVAALA